MRLPDFLILFVHLLFVMGGLACFYGIYIVARRNRIRLMEKILASIFLLLFGSIFTILGGGFIHTNWIQEDPPVPTNEYANKIFERLDKDHSGMVDINNEYYYQNRKYASDWVYKLKEADTNGDGLVSVLEWQTYISNILDTDGDGFLRNKAAGWKRAFGNVQEPEVIPYLY